MCKFSSKEKNIYIFFKQIDRRENSQKLSLRVYWMMTDGFLSGKKFCFSHSVRREWPLLVAIPFWKRVLAWLEHPLQGAERHQ